MSSYDPEPERTAGWPLSPQLVETGWRPISEAPKDGTNFLCYWKAPRAERPDIIIARWNGGAPWVGFYGVNVQDGMGHGTISHLSWGVPESLCATHWMPLPPPPDAPGSPQLDEPLRSRERAALDIAVRALRETRRVTILAVSAACELEDFRPEDTNVVRRIDRALDDVAALVPDAVK